MANQIFIDVSEKRIEQAVSWCVRGIHGLTRYPSMSYEQGVRAAIDWLTGDDDAAPDEP